MSRCMDGQWIQWNWSGVASPATWKTHRPSHITFGNVFETAFDELRPLLGDARTVKRLKCMQRHYLISLCCGRYDDGKAPRFLGQTQGADLVIIIEGIADQSLKIICECCRNKLLLISAHMLIYMPDENPRC